MTRYLLDTGRSEIEFSIRYLLMRARGRFTNFAGVIDLDAHDITRSTVTVEIDAASIATDGPARELGTARFFDLQKHPLIRFASSRVEEDGHYLRVVGDLTINGVTCEVVLRVEPLVSIKGPFRTDPLAFFASTSINRKDFGVSANLGSGDKVDINLDVQGTLVEARAAA